MGLVQNARNKIREEVEGYKIRRKMERDPEILKALIKDKQETQKRELDYAKDRKTLQDLKNSTGTRGAIRSALGSVKTHLANVKARNEKGEKFKLKDPSQSSNVVGGMSGVGMHSGIKGNSAIMSVGNGKSFVTHGSSGKKKGKGVFG